MTPSSEMNSVIAIFPMSFSFGCAPVGCRRFIRVTNEPRGNRHDGRIVSDMDFGIGYFPTADALGPDELARLVEARGHESLFFAEHTHIPASRQSPWPGGAELPR